MIRKIHRFWGGPNEMPENYKQFGKDWQRLNPTWQVIDWTEQDVLDMGLINQRVWDDLAVPAEGCEIDEVALATQRADVAGYEIIYRHGGLYVNTDIQPIRPLSLLMHIYPELAWFPAAAMEDDYWLVNAVIWAPEPGMSVWGDIIAALPGRYYSGGKLAYMNGTTGPHLLTTVARQHPGFLEIPSNVFNPLHFTEVEIGKDALFDEKRLTGDVIAVHHWGHRKNQRAQTASVPKSI
jgi:mannosyltransferase OCH1-like enzyme